jgi:hypothetical protein
MAVVLPRSFDYSQGTPSLPDGSTSNLITCRPISGNTFDPQGIIEVDLGNRGFADPKSFAIRYKVTAEGGATSGSAIAGTPLFAPFARVATLVGGASIDSISSYNLVAHVLTNLTYDIGQKYGLQSSLGFSNATAGNMMFLDGRFVAAGAGQTYTVGGPLLGLLLSSSEKMLPLFAMPQIRLQFTLDSLANIFCSELTGAGGVKAGVAFQISNFEFVYNMIDMGPTVEKMVYDMPAISIKAQGMSNSTIAVTNGASGSQSFVFNQRFASIRSAFACPTVSVANKWAEIVDLTNGNGSYQFVVGQIAVPQNPLSMNLNPSGCLQETRRAGGSLYDATNCFSINSTEFGKKVNDTLTDGLYYEPGKVIIGVNTNKLQTGDNAMFSGISTYNTPITLQVELGATPTNKVCNLNLILNYDAILQIDPKARQLAVRS